MPDLGSELDGWQEPAAEKGSQARRAQVGERKWDIYGRQRPRK